MYKERHKTEFSLKWLREELTAPYNSLQLEDLVKKVPSQRYAAERREATDTSWSTGNSDSV